jgi:mannitol/fructose-specific phosphotransferase system IIA component
MNKWANEYIVLRRRSTNSKEIHDEMFNILNHKGNVNQNYIEITFLPSENTQ